MNGAAGQRALDTDDLDILALVAPIAYVKSPADGILTRPESIGNTVTDDRNRFGRPSNCRKSPTASNRNTQDVKILLRNALKVRQLMP